MLIMSLTVLRKVILSLLLLFSSIVFVIVLFFQSNKCAYCFNLGGMLELAEAIRDYHDHIGLPYMV